MSSTNVHQIPAMWKHSYSFVVVMLVEQQQIANFLFCYDSGGKLVFGLNLLAEIRNIFRSTCFSFWEELMVYLKRQIPINGLLYLERS